MACLRFRKHLFQNRYKNRNYYETFQDSFMVWEGEQDPVERYVFLFKNKLMFTEKDSRKDPPSYKHHATIRVRHSSLTHSIS